MEENIDCAHFLGLCEQQVGEELSHYPLPEETPISESVAGPECVSAPSLQQPVCFLAYW